MAEEAGKEFLRELEKEMKARGYSRRDFLKVVSAMGASAFLAACGAQRRPQTEEGMAAAGTPVAGSTPTRAPSAAQPTPQVKVEWPSAEALGLKWPKTAVPEPKSKVEISVAHAWDAVFWTRQVEFDKLFMQRHPNIVVKAENTPWGDFLQKYVAQAAGGTMPDVMYVHFSWAQQLIQQGAIIPLDDFTAQQDDFNIDDFTRPSLVSYRKDGKLYCVPYDEGPGILYYNKEIFDKAKIDYPSDDWTLQDLKEVAIKLTQGEGPKKQFGFANTPSPGDATMAPAYLFPFGAQYVSEPNEDKCLITQPVAIDTMEWWMELRLKYGATPSPADLETLTWPAIQFGRIAMQLDGSWATPVINANAKFKWDVAKWPKGPKKHSTFSAGSGYAITKDSKNTDAAWIYLNEYLSTAGQIFMWASTGRGSPARNSAWPAYLSSKYAPPSAKIIQESLNEFASHAILDKPTAAQVTQRAGAVWDRVINGKLSVREGLFQVCREISPILARNRE